MMKNKSEDPRDRLLKLESRYRSLFEGIPIGLYITTPDGQIVDANPALVQMLGFPSKRALLGTMASELYLNPSDREREHALFKDDLVVRNYETQLKRQDGQLIWVRDTCRAIRDPSGDICHYEGSLQDITEEKAAEQRLNHMARHDPLTGVFNRYALAELLDKESSRAQRYKHPIGILMIDINRFKEVNDRFGHAAGDKVLQWVSKVLCSSVRDTDYVVRYGGDEFLLVLLETNGETKVVRDRILRAMTAQVPQELPIDFPVTLSIGIAHWLPDENISIETVLSQADSAMYECKQRIDAKQSEQAV